MSGSTPLVIKDPYAEEEPKKTERLDPEKVETTKRENFTARNYREKEEDLIMGVISTTRQMKRIIRKHSLELKRVNMEKKQKL